MNGRNVSVVASTAAALAVVVLVVGVVIVTPPSTTFVVVASVAAVGALGVGLLTGVGILVSAAYVLAGVGAAASVLADDMGPLRAALAGLVLFASSELSRLSLDARQPCRLDRAVLDRMGARLALTAAAVGGLLVVAAALGRIDLPRLVVPAGVLGAAALLGVLAGAGRAHGDDRVRRTVAAVAVLAVVVGALAAAAAVEQDRDDTPPVAEEQEVRASPVPVDDGSPGSDELDPGTILTLRFVGLALLALVALLLGGVLMLPHAALTLDPYELDPDDDLLLSGGAMTGMEEVADDMGTEAVTAVDEALADLTGDLEPGLAVRLAYDRVQRGFGNAEVARRPSESEAEYLGRLLTMLGVSAPAMGRLTDLFEQARFSEHRIDEEMRADAVAAFTAVRDELAVRARSGVAR